MIDVPFIPGITPWLLPKEPFEQMIAALGVRLLWLKSHTCPCSMGGQTPGTADPGCNTCQGLGTFWDQPFGPWTGLVTFVHMSPTPDEPGVSANTAQGNIQQGDPTLTIPASAGAPWTDASIYDAFVEIDALSRFSANLVLGGRQSVPYQHGLSIAASGAVQVYDPVAQQAVTVAGYTVSGATVLLPSSYQPGQAYTVEFSANPIYIAYRKSGGLPHARPFGQVQLPKRFRLQTLDLWTRARGAVSTSPQSVGAP
jgi:hypothetical protein